MIRVPGGWRAPAPGDTSSFMQGPLDLTPRIFIWPVTCDPYVTFPNIPVDTGECVPEFCELFRQITAFKEGVVGISNL